MATELLPALLVALSGVLAGGSILLVTALLASDRGRVNALGFLLGYVGAYAAIGLSVVAADADVAAWTSGDAGRAGPVALTVVGLAFLALGLRTARRPRADAASVDGAGRIALLDRATPVRTFALGVAVTVVNVKNLALFLTAIAVLQASDLTAQGKLAGAPLVALTFCLGVFVPVVIDAVVPARSDRLLATVRRGLDRYGRPAARWLPLVVGAVFVVRGVRGLA